VTNAAIFINERNQEGKALSYEYKLVLGRLAALCALMTI
jgi:hypothetical protein